MDRNNALLWSYLGILTKPRYDALVQVFGSIDAAADHIDESLLRELRCKDEIVKTTLERFETFDVRNYEAKLAERGIEFFTIEDEEYPLLLREIGDPPIFLYAKGDRSILTHPTVALVGTRQMSNYGKRIVEQFIPEFVHAGVTTVSGLAAGIDAAVARATLAAGGKTVAVLGHGLSSIFPQSNAQLAEDIIAAGGLLLSEFPLDQMPGKYTFPARNRIIAGLSLATVVLEAPLGSGALITSDLALDYGRDVFIVPGQIFDPTFEGSNREIARGHGKLAMSPCDVLAELGIVKLGQGKGSGTHLRSAPQAWQSYGGQAGVLFEPRTDEEARVFSVLTTMPQRFDDLVLRSGLATPHVTSTLTMMELAGAAKNVGNGEWVKT